MALDFTSEVEAAIKARRSRSPRRNVRHPALAVVGCQRAFTESPRPDKTMTDTLKMVTELLDSAGRRNVPIIYAVTVQGPVGSLPSTWRPEFIDEVAFIALLNGAGRGAQFDGRDGPRRHRDGNGPRGRLLRNRTGSATCVAGCRHAADCGYSHEQVYPNIRSGCYCSDILCPGRRGVRGRPEKVVGRSSIHRHFERYDDVVSLSSALQYSVGISPSNPLTSDNRLKTRLMNDKKKSSKLVRPPEAGI